LRLDAVGRRRRQQAKSMPLAPASIVCTKRSWPGTSTSEHARVDRQIGEARSMVMPRAFFLLQPIAVDPGERFDQAVLPWSIWPAGR